MTEPSRRASPRRLGAAAVGALASVAVLATPGVAAAATGLVPLVDCVTVAADGGYDAVLGYRADQATDVPYGPENRLDPPSDHPTAFLAGTRHAAFVLHVEPGAPPPRWTLAGTELVVDPTAAEACSTGPSTPAPDEERGPLLALVGTGLLGSSLRLVARRRAIVEFVRTRRPGRAAHLLLRS